MRPPESGAMLQPCGVQLEGPLRTATQGLLLSALAEVAFALTAMIPSKHREGQVGV